MTATLLTTRRIQKEDWHSIPACNGLTQGEKRPGSSDERWKAIIDRVASFRDLGENWDGQGASGISEEVLTSAIGLAHLIKSNGLHAPARAVPGPEGTVLFEWQDPDGTYCEVEVIRPFFAEVMLLEPGKPAQHWSLPQDG